VQVCLDFCILCGRPGSEFPLTELECQRACIGEMMDATTVCDRKLAERYQCQVDKALQYGCGATGEIHKCVNLMPEVIECLNANGCEGDGNAEVYGCGPEENDAGPPTCNCGKTCWPHPGEYYYYQTECVSSAVGSHCDCFQNHDPIGSCEQLDFVCDVWTSCCRKYFDL
jgi:hypothetical protein